MERTIPASAEEQISNFQSKNKYLQHKNIKCRATSKLHFASCLFT